MPILRAVPFTIDIALSKFAAFKSGILISAISFTCDSVTLPTFSLWGSAEPFFNFEASKIKKEKGTKGIPKDQLSPGMVGKHTTVAEAEAWATHNIKN